ncbi:MAG: formate dehydrogenase accessory sulfurtransferase FdhD [Candidatus Heimdallarchaeota archaeon]
MENELTIDTEAIQVWKMRGVQRLQEKVIREEPINIYLNDTHIVTLLALPEKHKALSIGHLLSEGIIKNLDEVKDIECDGNTVQVTIPNLKLGRIKAYRTLKLVTTACGSTSEYLRLLDSMDPPKAASGLQLPSSILLEMRRRMPRTKFPVHIAALFRSDATRISFAEDVGRHNAVDKVIGEVSLSKQLFSDLTLISSGRVPADMILKAARVGLPIVGSFSGPVSSGVLFAKKSNVTLISFLRRNRLTIYSHFRRITLPPE